MSTPIYIYSGIPGGEEAEAVRGALTAELCKPDTRATRAPPSSSSAPASSTASSSRTPSSTPAASMHASSFTDAAVTPLLPAAAPRGGGAVGIVDVATPEAAPFQSRPHACQYVYVCTGKASRLITCGLEACAAGCVLKRVLQAPERDTPPPPPSRGASCSCSCAPSPAASFSLFLAATSI